MYAVVRTGGKQYRVEPGSVVDIEKLGGEAGDSVEIPEVLLLCDGKDITVGRPLVQGARVSAMILEQTKGKKQIIFKKIRRQGKQLTKGHRQLRTRIEVKEILRA